MEDRPPPFGARSDSLAMLTHAPHSLNPPRKEMNQHDMISDTENRSRQQAPRRTGKSGTDSTPLAGLGAMSVPIFQSPFSLGLDGEWGEKQNAECEIRNEMTEVTFQANGHAEKN